MGQRKTIPSNIFQQETPPRFWDVLNSIKSYESILTSIPINKTRLVFNLKMGLIPCLLEEWY